MELGTIIIHRGEGGASSNSVNNAKARRREELLSELTDHDYVDREQGILTVPLTHNKFHNKIARAWSLSLMPSSPSPESPESRCCRSMSFRRSR